MREGVGERGEREGKRERERERGGVIRNSLWNTCRYIAKIIHFIHEIHASTVPSCVCGCVCVCGVSVLSSVCVLGN